MIRERPVSLIATKLFAHEVSCVHYKLLQLDESLVFVTFFSPEAFLINRLFRLLWSFQVLSEFLDRCINFRNVST